MRIEVRRSGGFANIGSTVSLDSNDLAESEVRRLKELLDAARIDDLAARSPIRGRGADRFQYDLIVTREGGLRHVTVAEDALSPELREVIDRVLDRG